MSTHLLGTALKHRVTLHPPATAVAPELRPGQTADALKAAQSCRDTVELVLVLLLLWEQKAQKRLVRLRVEGPHETATLDMSFINRYKGRTRKIYFEVLLIQL